VRIGASEFYLLIEQFFPEIEDSIVIGQPWKDDVRVILFVKMKAGKLTPQLKNQIAQKIRERLSPRSQSSPHHTTQHNKFNVVSHPLSPSKRGNTQKRGAKL
jgi:acyl-coenzyme A synthetase/AMP-(fatty) acid ligase